MVHVIEMPDPAHVAVADCGYQAAAVQPQVACDEDYAQHHGQHHAEGLQVVCPYYRPDSSPEGVQYHDSDRNQYIQREWQPHRVEDKKLQGDAYEEQSYRCPEHLGNEEEPGSCLV